MGRELNNCLKRCTYEQFQEERGISLALGRSSIHCFKSMEGHTCCSKINSFMESCQALAFQEGVLCWQSPQTASTVLWPQEMCLGLKEGRPSGPFLLVGASLDFTHHPVCLGFCLILSLQRDFYPCRCIPDTKLQLYNPVQLPVT